MEARGLVSFCMKSNDVSTVSEIVGLGSGDERWREREGRESAQGTLYCVIQLASIRPPKPSSQLSSVCHHRSVKCTRCRSDIVVESTLPKLNHPAIPSNSSLEHLIAQTLQSCFRSLHQISMTCFSPLSPSKCSNLRTAILAVHTAL
jgi:hypothetical protein